MMLCTFFWCVHMFGNLFYLYNNVLKKKLKKNAIFYNSISTVAVYLPKGTFEGTLVFYHCRECTFVHVK